MTFTAKQIDGAALQIAAEAMGGIPTRIADYLTENQTNALMDEIRAAVSIGDAETDHAAATIG